MKRFVSIAIFFAVIFFASLIPEENWLMHNIAHIVVCATLCELAHQTSYFGLRKCDKNHNHIEET